MRRSFLGFLAIGIMLTTIVAIAPAGDAKDEAIKKDRKQIEGKWRVVALEVDGNKAMEEDAKKLTVVIGSDGTWNLYLEDKENNKGTSTIDPSKKPKTIDLTPAKGDGKGLESSGIYEVSEKTLKICIGPSGKERPTEFSSISGSGTVLVTFEREKDK
jgi:uncharacterized protein (TIGR03067 family)